MKKISLALSEYLKKHNITQYWLVKQSGVNVATVRSYQRNTVRRYDAHVLEKLCTTLNCDITDIIKCIDIDE